MKRRMNATEKARKKMGWPHATVGVPAGDKRAGRIKQANALEGKGGGGIQDAMLPAWKRKRLKK
ncbi:MAG: hypothetical protein JW744_05985 [Candidatus Diapherotrites archaeon]|uniref:Uncharacterized protein n=1 Tax=Candidatus Iainarchaeum sp. TaxID=3101447 RepID=A0A938YYG0_9ARCH|nr:hypothetical protein [Candidatus Diapherotrites archaeon]